MTAIVLSTIEEKENPMFQALLHGKLSRSQENMEDILTSNVFGTLKYLPSEAALIPFLAKAATPDGECPLGSVPLDVEADYFFWPWLDEPKCNGCEPDVLIRINNKRGENILVLIEAKYRSGKSSETNEGAERPNDQLAREWDNLQRLARRESREPILIYLTADMGCPREDIRASQEELERKRGERGEICWLSWRHLLPVISDESPAILRDLGALLRRLNLTLFDGFSTVETFAPVQWTFSSVPVLPES